MHTQEVKPEITDWNDLPLILNREHMCQLIDRGDKTLTRKLHLKKVIAPLNEGDGNNMWLRDRVKKWFEDGCPPGQK